VPEARTSQESVNGSRAERSTVITSPAGLHLRPLTAFAQLASSFPCDVRFSHGGRSVDGKQAWEMMTMLALPESEVTIKTEGPNAPEALEALVNLLQRWAEIDAAAD